MPRRNHQDSFIGDFIRFASLPCLGYFAFSLVTSFLIKGYQANHNGRDFNSTDAYEAVIGATKTTIYMAVGPAAMVIANNRHTRRLDDT
jgi:hypothetical protein